ncbi:MAG: hypothetical protein JO202_02420 [Ktedonobacteraceae bacterium]|nr:hypothetical protein [Ktedonobacteraceae bacterium]
MDEFLLGKRGVFHGRFESASGVVERIEDDPNGTFFNTLAEHYAVPWRNPGDARVVLCVKVHQIVGQNL